MDKPKAIIIMKVGPHSNMSLEEIVNSKKEEEKYHNVHFWGYSGVFCQPKQTQEFCRWAFKKYNEYPKLILLETKSSYESEIGCITKYSEDKVNYEFFKKPVQLQGAQFSFVAKDIKEIPDFRISDYLVVGGKNDGVLLNKHLRFRINKSFAELNPNITFVDSPTVKVLSVTLVPPFAIWLKE